VVGGREGREVDDLLPIGRFSKATRLSVKALRHYDELGLLRPAFVDPSSGYRYYRPAQANQAEAIRILRSLEMPLEEIRAVLAEGGGDLAGKRLHRHRGPPRGTPGRAPAHARVPPTAPGQGGCHAVRGDRP